MTDGLGVVAAIIRGIFGAAAHRAGQPRLKVIVWGTRESVGVLSIWVKATNEGGAAITIDTVSSWVRARRGRGGIASVAFGSGPTPPFRLESHSSAEWTAEVRTGNHWWMAGPNVDCTAFIPVLEGAPTAEAGSLIANAAAAHCRMPSHRACQKRLKHDRGRRQ